jgi:hypothetical protein
MEGRFTERSQIMTVGAGFTERTQLGVVAEAKEGRFLRNEMAAGMGEITERSQIAGAGIPHVEQFEELAVVASGFTASKSLILKGR